MNLFTWDDTELNLWLTKDCLLASIDNLRRVKVISKKRLSLCTLHQTYIAHHRQFATPTKLDGRMCQRNSTVLLKFSPLSLQATYSITVHSSNDRLSDLSHFSPVAQEVSLVGFDKLVVLHFLDISTSLSS